MAHFKLSHDPRILEIGSSAFFCHYRINGEDYVLRLWQTGTIRESGVKVSWVCQIRTETGDWSNIVPCSPEFINNRRSR